jgi:ferredoxin
VTSAIRVNPVDCQAYGYCAELLPELVSLDEWGYPIVADGPIPAELEELARLAAKECPRRAFLLGRGAPGPGASAEGWSR